MSLVLSNITFQYPGGKKPVIVDYSAEFKEGVITAVTGSNGCGKTTLSKLMLGIHAPSEGRVTLDQQNVSAMSLAEVGRKIGYVMQNPAGQLFCSTVTEEVEYGLKNLGLTQSEIEARRDKYLRYFSIDHYKDSLPHQLSEGEKQRLVLAAVLAMEPEYLLLDEPTSALDIYRKKLLGEHLKEICRESGCGIIVISHDLEFVDSYCEEILEMPEPGRKLPEKKSAEREGEL